MILVVSEAGGGARACLEAVGHTTTVGRMIGQIYCDEKKALSRCAF